MGYLKLIVVGLAVTGCSFQAKRDEAALRSGFTPMTTRADFVENTSGRQWQSDEILVRFQPDGTLVGEVNGVPVSGTWTWANAMLCSDFRVGDSGGDGCSQVGIKPGELLAVPLSGTGAPYTYTEVTG